MSALKISFKNEDYLTYENGKISASGCHDFLSSLKAMIKKNGADVSTWTLQGGTDHSSLLINEFILRVKNQWNYPYNDTELCHCRAVPTEKVDAAIVSGAHTTESISRRTSAGTACGTCRTDTIKILDFRLKMK